MILDSNLIIYAAKPEFPGLRRWIATKSPVVSAVSVVEVLGYHKLSAADRMHFEEFFTVAKVLPVTDSVIAQAVALRQLARCRWVIVSSPRRLSSQVKN